MIRAYDELVDLIASGCGPEGVANFQASAATRQRVEDLISKEKSRDLSVEEESELDHYLHLEHVVRLAKARAHERLSHD
ncbi:MAG: hypothetical protein U0805_06820 [Pirellulales bacterium]